MARPEAIVAAEWWAKAIQAPKFDNGDKSETGGLVMLMGMMAAGPRPTVDKTQAFAMELQSAIEAELGKFPHLTLAVDYHPDKILSDAAERAQIQSATFPWKTIMWIEPGKVTVKYGYGAKDQVIYPAEAR